MKQHLQGIKDIQDRKNTNEKKTLQKSGNYLFFVMHKLDEGSGRKGNSKTN